MLKTQNFYSENKPFDLRPEGIANYDFYIRKHATSLVRYAQNYASFRTLALGVTESPGLRKGLCVFEKFST